MSKSNDHGSEDLNLLKTLDLLLAERSVTRTARRLGVTQSAVSHKLKQLREWFGDPLLVGGRRGMVLTERAEQIAGPLRRALVELRSVVRSARPFDPATSSRVFVLGTSDYGEFETGPRVAEKLASLAPGIRIVVDPPGPDVIERLEAGRMDLAIGPAFRPAFENPSLRRITLLREGFVLVLRADHPALDSPITLDTYLSLGHIQIAPTGRPGGLVDEILARQNLARRVVFRTPHFVAAPFIAARSDLALTAPVGLARLASQYVSIRLLPMPFALPELEIFLLWHERQQHDPGHLWLRTLVSEMSRSVKS